ncbi:MAG: Flp pilus assembly complex ATPase component TadA [Planctomycetes bacterium]|nr:Flp pilus assembly complex ATPase component TadA [Planctomycetota bacterium]MCK5578344.1 Flp pilus assembly complex ATPase component TadA [Planctomycetota bacterium]
MLSIIDKKISNILRKKGLLDKEKSKAIEQEASKNNKSFVDVVLDKSLVNENELLGAIAGEVNIPPISIEKVEPDQKALELFSEEKASFYGVLPLARIGNVLTLVVSNPFDVVQFDDIRLLTKCDLRLTLSLGRKVQEMIKRFYHLEEDHKLEDVLDDVAGADLELAEEEVDEKLDLSQLSGESGSPVVKLVNMLIYRALNEGASDLHMEPYDKKVRVRFRQDGVLHEVFFPPKRLHNAIASRIKIMTNLNISERRVPQDGKFQIKFKGRRVDFRVSITPTVHGERVVMRVLDSSALDLSLESLGFEERGYKVFEESINASYGMVLVTGPTGSGKTTSLYCAIRQIYDPEENLITVEDPVEYQLPGIIQVPVNARHGVTFAAALRSILRQDPDIIMIGEVRDLETADIAVKAAITGHLVFSTLHTNDAVSTISRLVDLGIDPFMISSSLLMVANQRLVRKLCPYCKEKTEVSKKRMLDVGFKPEDIGKHDIYKPIGCDRCLKGYKGRMALFESLEIDDDVRRLIINEESILDIKDYAVKNLGMLTLRDVGLLKVKRGETTIEEVLRVTG